MDSLSQLIALLAPESSIDLHCRFAGRWASDHAQSPAGHIPWHAIISGNARLVLNGEVITAQAGDIFLLPHGAPHRLESHKQDGARAPVQRYENGVITEVVTEGDDAPLVMLCGEFRTGVSGALLFSGQPAVQRIATGARDDCRSLTALLTMLSDESLSGRPGAEAIVRELSSTLLTLVLRALLSEENGAPGMLPLLADKRLAPAVSAVLANPEHPWTLESMAACCFLSRSTFARHFASRYPLTPQGWLNQVRMARAARLLEREQRAIGRVAEACGYLTQAAFSKAFKSAWGVTPGQFRQQHARI
ncbi:cupin domain-containing protein [Cronobacter turicensis]|nr:cupin domain-containing protein [Cronobacter turicensis]EKY3200958.1 cupin domain-containing protein [Cronobacter turicensis]EKY3210172.1 cupin domain-containing protein [Cronobacter turicensis]EKY3215339.1 cupin domain-containing protein [Cronobacter turicensis]EKY3217631.1 cupin domain-containing protein [Cronobacter turicensis]